MSEMSIEYSLRIHQMCLRFKSFSIHNCGTITLHIFQSPRRCITWSSWLMGELLWQKILRSSKPRQSCPLSAKNHTFSVIGAKINFALPRSRFLLFRGCRLLWKNESTKKIQELPLFTKNGCTVSNDLLFTFCLNLEWCPHRVFLLYFSP